MADHEITVDSEDFSDQGYAESTSTSYSTRSKVLDRCFDDPAPPPPTPQLWRVTFMPPPRRFGQEITGNTQRRPSISPADRQSIIAKRECGVTVRELAAEFGRSEGAIKYTIRTYANTGTTQEQPRSGRPHVLSLHQKKIIWHALLQR
jgi:hypothetical protein